MNDPVIAKVREVVTVAIVGPIEVKDGVLNFTIYGRADPSGSRVVAALWEAGLNFGDGDPNTEADRALCRDREGQCDITIPLIEPYLVDPREAAKL